MDFIDSFHVGVAAPVTIKAGMEAINSSRETSKKRSGLAEGNMTLRHSLDHLPISSSAISLSSISYTTQRSSSVFPQASTARKGKPNFKPRRCLQTKVTGKPYKHIPHRLKPAHLVAKRNARERKRVQAVNSAFFKLRKHVPHEDRHRRLSKVKTLRYAIEYIQHLQKLIEKHDRYHSEQGQTLNVSPNYSHCQHRNFILNQGSLDIFSEEKTCLAEVSRIRENYRDTNCPEGGPVNSSRTCATSLDRLPNAASPHIFNLHFQPSPSCLSKEERVTESLPITHRGLQSRHFHNSEEYTLSHETRLCCTLSVYQFDRVSRQVNTHSTDQGQITYETPFSQCLPFHGSFLFSENSVSELPCETAHHKQLALESSFSNQHNRSLPISQHQTYGAPSGPVSSCRVITGLRPAPASTGYPAPLGSVPVYLSRCTRSARDDNYITTIPGLTKETDQNGSLTYSGTYDVLCTEEDCDVHQLPTRAVSPDGDTA